eukprot:scaffold53188_cov25-Tisochrysis_lutea.AAC.2
MLAFQAAAGTAIPCMHWWALQAAVGTATSCMPWCTRVSWGSELSSAMAGALPRALSLRLSTTQQVIPVTSGWIVKEALARSQSLHLSATLRTAPEMSGACAIVGRACAGC